MRYGMPLASGLGSPDNTIEYINFDPPTAATVRVYFKARSGYGNAWFGVYNNCILTGNVYAAEGQSLAVNVPLNFGASQASINLLRLGHLGDPGYNVVRVARAYEADAQRATLTWMWKPGIIGPLSDGGYTSAWALNGLSHTNTSMVSGKLTWSQLSFDMQVSGGIAALTVRNRSTQLATGSGPVGTTLTLSQLNGSGVNGTVAIASGAMTTLNASVNLRWPQRMKIKRGTSDPPSTVVATVTFDGLDTASWTEPTDLAASTYYYRLNEVSDTGQDGTDSASYSVTIVGPPASPFALAYASGNAASGITLNFAPSSTSGASYHLYLGMPGQQMNLNTISATAAAGATQITTPAISGAPGTARVLLRAVTAGVEEKNLGGFDIPLDASDNYIAPAPNKPAIVQSSIGFSSGLALALRGTYSTLSEAGVATQLQLFTRSPSGSYNFASPAATAALTSTSSHIKSAPLAYTFGAPGYYYIALLAITAGGIVGAVSDEILVYASAEAMLPPDLSAIYVSRG